MTGGIRRPSASTATTTMTRTANPICVRGPVRKPSGILPDWDQQECLAKGHVPRVSKPSERTIELDDAVDRLCDRPREASWPQQKGCDIGHHHTGDPDTSPPPLSSRQQHHAENDELRLYQDGQDHRDGGEAPPLSGQRHEVSQRDRYHEPCRVASIDDPPRRDGRGAQCHEDDHSLQTTCPPGRPDGGRYDRHR